MKISNVNKKFLQFGALFIVMAVLFAWLYNIGVNRPPLKYAHVPQSTKDFLNNLGEKNGDQGLSYKDQGPFNWDNDDNLGEKNWEKEEDANFVVYYHKDMEATWQGYAQQVLHAANDNIASLTDLMGKYYKAVDMNGRKLAIYLPENEDLYASTITTLMGQDSGDAKGTLGITITQVGPLGCLTKGIVLNPVCFQDAPNGINGYLKTLKHEMNHYVFFSSLNYDKPISHYLWVSEGLAEFYCSRNDKQQVHGSDSIQVINQSCMLNAEFPMEGDCQYWAGESFYLFLESQGGVNDVKQFLKLAYQTSTDSVFIRRKTPAKTVHKNWVNYLLKAKPVAPAITQPSNSVAVNPKENAPKTSQRKK